MGRQVGAGADSYLAIAPLPLTTKVLHLPGNRVRRGLRWQLARFGLCLMCGIHHAVGEVSQCPERAHDYREATLLLLSNTVLGLRP